MTDFLQKSRDAEHQSGSILCVGLDPDADRIPGAKGAPDPAGAVVAFCREIIRATSDVAAAYKLNFAFFEALGVDGWQALADVRAMLPPHAIAIADAKRGDIGNSGRFYAQSVYDQLSFDACTVSPYMGRDSIMPFANYPGRCAYILGRTSNNGARDLQLLTVDGRPVYQHVAELVRDISSQCDGTCGLVSGATDFESMRVLRSTCPDSPFLVPGVGAQGADPAGVIAAGYSGPGSLLVNSSRAILYASPGRDYAEAAAAEARSLAALLAREVAKLPVGLG